MFDYLKKIIRTTPKDDGKQSPASTEDVMADFGAAFDKPENLPTEELEAKGIAGGKSGGAKA